MEKISEYIPVGHENGLRLSELVGISGIPRRQVRRQIAREQAQGTPIINLSDGCGYFLADNEQELRDYVRQERSRIANEKKKVGALMMTLKEMEAKNG